MRTSEPTGPSQPTFHSYIQVNYSTLLSVFWASHEAPYLYTTVWPDWAYWSKIFYTSDDERVLAQQSFDAIQATSSSPVVTVIQDATHLTFWHAEDYHQDYFRRWKHKTCQA
jgi:peptide-methionine (S)-S-oxide reductase